MTRAVRANDPVLTLRMRAMLFVAAAGRVKRTGGNAETLRALRRKGLVAFVPGDGYTITAKGAELAARIQPAQESTTA